MALQYPPFYDQVVLDQDGNLAIGGTLEAFYVDTAIPAPLFNEDGNELIQPLLVDSDGRLPIYKLNSDLTYRLVLKDVNDVPLRDANGVKSGGGDGDSDVLVKVSAEDAVANYLEEKLVEGTGINITKLDAGGNEQLEISSSIDPDGFVTLDTDQTITGEKTIQNNLIIDGIDKQIQFPGGISTRVPYIGSDVSSGVSMIVDDTSIPGTNNESYVRVGNAIGFDPNIFIGTNSDNARAELFLNARPEIENDRASASLSTKRSPNADGSAEIDMDSGNGTDAEPTLNLSADITISGQGFVGSSINLRGGNVDETVDPSITITTDLSGTPVSLLALDSNDKLVDGGALLPGIPASTVDGSFVLKNADGSYMITYGVTSAPFRWDDVAGEFAMGAQFRIPAPLVVSDTGIITLDDASGANHSIYTGTDNLIIQSDGVGGMVLQSTNGIATSADVDLNGVTDTQSGQLLANDPTSDQQVATKKYVDGNTIPNTAISTGVIEPILITMNVDPTKFDVSAGTGVIWDWSDPTDPKKFDINFAGAVGVSLVSPASLFTSVYIDNTGTLNQLPGGALSPQQKRQNISLQTVVHTDGVNITDVLNSYIPAYQQTEALLDYVDKAGTINEGNTFSDNGANLELSKALGNSTLPFINAVNDTQAPVTLLNPATNGDSFLISYQDGLGGWNTVPSTVIDPNVYDDGTGILATVGNNKFSNRFCFFFGSVDISTIVIGNQQYNTLQEAIDGIQVEFSELVINPNITSGATITTVLSVAKGATDLSNASDAVFTDVLDLLGIGGGNSAITPDLQAVTDVGSTTTNNIDALSFNGVPLTDAGGGTNFLADDGTYKPAGGTSTEFTVDFVHAGATSASVVMDTHSSFGVNSVFYIPNDGATYTLKGMVLSNGRTITNQSSTVDVRAYMFVGTGAQRGVSNGTLVFDWEAMNTVGPQASEFYTRSNAIFNINQVLTNGQFLSLDLIPLFYTMEDTAVTVTIERTT